ncbi:MAG: Smr/MutS family protein [Wenzhouxiangellaceae bacterium]
MHQDDDDPDLFRQLVGPVRRIHSRREPPPAKPLRARPHKRDEDERRVLDELHQAMPLHDEPETGEELSWLRTGLRPQVLRKLRRGHWSVQDEIDLHQMNVEAATRSIRIFLDEALAGGRRCVKIIHGKGLRSGPGGPRLKTVTARVLSRHPRVLAFTSARPVDGGSGAVYVLLQARA